MLYLITLSGLLNPFLSLPFLFCFQSAPTSCPGSCKTAFEGAPAECKDFPGFATLFAFCGVTPNGVTPNGVAMNTIVPSLLTLVGAAMLI